MMLSLRGGRGGGGFVGAEFNGVKGETDAKRTLAVTSSYGTPLDIECDPGHRIYIVSEGFIIVYCISIRNLL